ncbi:MAG: U32 family peptidase [Treponema sp.]|jgi:putative protease|nr:U32 family peptidase [Treponema sp.]
MGALNPASGRRFNGKRLELLAPAGNFAILRRIAGARCDAVYFGGKRFNMRLHRKDYNFSYDELREAVSLVQGQGKRAYITVNNMYTQEELPALAGYLDFLAGIRPDALIVQDPGVLSLIRRLELPLAVHASVMMNVHNLASIRGLEEWGLSRVIMSREMSLAEIRAVSARTDMELEYFVHGDMCVAHGGQCLYSGILFGASSNQGRCLKPCRWDFRLECGGKIYPTEFPLAVKDLCLYGHIPELIHSGISVFKIEGRMRDGDYLEALVNAYGDALDRYLAEPLAYDPETGAEALYGQRKRDFSTAYAFGRPGLANINRRMEGTGAFYSTGKPFSAATEEPELTPLRIGRIRDYLAGRDRGNTRRPELACKVQTGEQAGACFRMGVDRVYLSGEVFLPHRPFSVEDINRLAAAKGSSRLYLCQSRMMFDRDIEEYRHALGRIRGIDGIVATSLGGIREAARTGLEIRGDYALNIQNSAAWEFYRAEGLGSFTLSAETRLADTAALLAESGDWAEIIVFGSPTVMYLEHDLFENTQGEADVLYLIDGKGFRHPVYRDKRGRNHLLLYRDISGLPFLKELHRAGLSCFRLEIAHLEQGAFERSLAVFKKLLAEADGDRETILAAILAEAPPRQGFSPGAWAFCGDTASGPASGAAGGDHE